MADEPTDEIEDETESENTVKSMRQHIKKLEKELAESTSLKREMAFLKAGVDTDSPVGKMFAKAYDGELDPEKIKAEATTIPGVLKTLEEVPSEELPADEQKATEERQALATGAEPDTPVTADPRAAAREAADEARKSGATEEKALATQFQALGAAAMAGDKRVLVQPVRQG